MLIESPRPVLVPPHPARILHPRGRRVGGDLRVPERRRRLGGCPRRGGREPRPHGAASRRRARAPRQPASGPFRRRVGGRRALAARRPPESGQHGERHARPRARDRHRGLRAGAVRRSACRDRGGVPCRLAGRVQGCAGGDAGPDGGAGRRADEHRGGARPDDRSGQLRGRAGNSSPASPRRIPPTATSSVRAAGPSTRCSTCPAISAGAWRRPASRRSRLSACAPTRTRRGSTPTGAPPTGGSPITAA